MSVLLHQKKIPRYSEFSDDILKLLPMDWMLRFQAIQSGVLGVSFSLKKLFKFIVKQMEKQLNEVPSEQLRGPLPLRSFATCRNGSREAKGIATDPEVLTNNNSFGAGNFFHTSKKVVGKQIRLANWIGFQESKKKLQILAKTLLTKDREFYMYILTWFCWPSM